MFKLRTHYHLHNWAMSLLCAARNSLWIRVKTSHIQPFCDFSRQPKDYGSKSLFPVILQDKDWTVEKRLSFWQRTKNMFEKATNFLNKHFRVSQKWLINCSKLTVCLCRCYRIYMQQNCQIGRMDRKRNRFSLDISSVQYFKTLSTRTV